MGVLRNRPGSGRALVVDLKPNKLYTFRIYQFASACLVGFGWRCSVLEDLDNKQEVS